MKKTKRKEVFGGRTIEELEALTSDLDESFVIDKFGPYSEDVRKEWERAKRKPGRPRVGKGAKIVSVSIEGGLLERIDRAARQRKITRAKFIAVATKRLLEETTRSPSRPRKRAA